MKKPKFIPEFDDIPTPRTKMPELALEERELSFDEVELGFTEELALGEAVRCLSCRRCIGCGLCLAECDRDAIVYDQTAETSTVRVDDVVLATGSSGFDASRKPELGYESSMNVVTTRELERLLSATGPYAGLPLRPGDGTLPRRVAFVQCVGSREEGIGADYCSSTCCTDALELASRLRDRLGRAEVTILHRGMRPLGRRAEALFRAAESGDGPVLRMAMVTGVSGPDCEGPVTVTYDTGSGDTEEEFDLVVLSTGRTSGATRGAARRFRADTNKFGFASTDPLAPLETSAERVLAAGDAAGPTDLRRAGVGGAAAAAMASRGDDYLKDAGDDGVRGADDVPASEASAGDQAAGGGGFAAGRGPVIVCVCEQGMSAGELASREVVREVGRLDEVTLAVSLKLACGHESLDRLQDLAGGLAGGRVLVVGCFPGTHAAILGERFASGLPSAGAVRPVGVRRGETAPEVAERVAALLAGGGATGARSTVRPEPRLLVAGGGLAGMTAALEAAAHGVPVTLVESTGELAGPPPPAAAADPEQTARWKLVTERVSSSPLVDVRLGTGLTALEPAEGGFRATFDGGEGEVYGALIVATGARELETPAVQVGTGTVLTQRQMPGAVADGDVSGDVVMVQCVGSRSAEHPWCSRTCCADALRNALLLKQSDAAADITVLHRGIRVWGFDEEFLSEAIDQGVSFVEVEDTAEVTTDARPSVSATAVDAEAIALEPDVVVLSTGLEPSPETAEVARLIGVELEQDGFFREAGKVTCGGAVADVRAYVCGRSAGPATVGERITQAVAAAGKACLFLKRGDDEAQ